MSSRYEDDNFNPEVGRNASPDGSVLRARSEKVEMRLKGKVALVTGGNSGIGLATARLFVAEGARVVVTGRNEGTLTVAAKELGESTIAIKSDVTDANARAALFDMIREKFGRLDIVFANAGMVKGGPIADVSEAVFDEVLKTNVTGVFLTVQAALPLLRAGASIILNGSVAASGGFFPGAGPYAASKAGIRGMCQSMAAELGSRGIRINVVVPGAIDTQLWGQHLLPPDAAAARFKRIQAKVPLNRWGGPDDIARAVLFLASDDSSYVHGSELFVDGGLVGATFGAPVHRA
jgi:NAD(P)-dependent dehydrogenase (short-subunit alcohol dehydrogenase family)